MRYFVLTTLTSFLVGLFTVGLVMAADEPLSSERGAVQSQQSQDMEQQRMESQGQQQQDIGTAAGRQEQQATGGQQLSSSDVREVQQALQEEGVDPGPIDGIMGPKTQAAIEQFQQEKGIAASGQMDRETAEALDVQLEGQEFMGVSPAFGEKEKQEQQQDKGLQQQEQMQEEKSPEKKQY